MSPAGPSKLPELGKGLGKTVKSFQNAAKVRRWGGLWLGPDFDRSSWAAWHRPN